MAYESLKAEIRQYIKTNGANEITGQILQNILIDMVNEYPSLSGYATQQWVESQEYLTSADLSQYATKSWVQQQGYATQQWVNNQHFIDYIGDVEADFNFADFHDLGGGVYQLHSNHTQTNKPIVYGVLVDFESQNGHMQLAAGPNNKLYFRSYWWTLNPDGFTYTDWQAMATASQLGNYLPLSAGNTKPLTGNLYINTSGGGRSQLYLVSPTDVPNDLYFGSNGSNHWSITSRASTDGNYLAFYSTGASVGIGRAGFTAVVGYTTGIWNFALTPTVNGTPVSLNGHTHSYLPLVGGSLTGDLTFQSGNGISVYYQYGDPSDPEYDVIMIKDGVVSVGNGGDITIGGNSVATQYWVGQQGYLTSVALGGLTDVTVNIPIANNSILSFNGLMWTNVSKSTFLNGYATESWVGQNYLALSGGTMANTNRVTNMNADLLDGFHSFGQTTPGLLYKYYQKFENSTTPSSDYVVKIVLDVNWWNKLTTLTLEASYSNRNGVLYLDLDSADDRWRCYHTAYNTNFMAIKRVHNTTNGNTEIYIKLMKPTEYSGSTPKGDVKIWAPVQIISMSVVSGQDIPQDMITLYYGYNSNTPVNASLSGWYLNNIVTTGYIQSSTANLQSYWCKVWDMTITSYQYNDIDITFLAASAFQGLEGIIHLKIRQNGTTGAYNFEKYVKLLAGNIPLGRVKLYCNNATGKCELWMNVNQQYGVFNVSILKKTLRYGNDRATLGTLYSTDFTTVQTPPSLTDTEIVTMTAYNSLVNAVKDGDGNTITSTYLKLAGGSLTGDLTFLNGNGISVYYQYGDPSDPEYDVILIKDGVVSVGNGGDITIGGNSVATQHWVGQNYLALSGGTVNGTLLVNGNLSSQSGLYAGNSSNAYYCSIINNGSLTSISSTDGNEHYEDMEIHADSVVFDTLGSVYGDFVNTSDSRLKTILANDILPTVEQVAGAPAIRYKWNELANKKNTEAHLGSIAQYWQPILPETVVQDNKGYLAMQYDVIALVSTIALARRIIELEKELSEIKQQIKN